MRRYRNRSRASQGNTGGQAKHAGFTLVEMLVALVVSLLMMAAVVEIFLQSKTSYKLQEGIARAQENGRIALFIVEQHLRRAGYPMDALPQVNGFAKDKVSAAVFSNTPIEAGSTDILVLQYQAPAGGIVDCAGRQVAENEYLAMRFFISEENLRCETADTGSGTKVGQTLLEGVSGMDLTYGEDTDGDGVPNNDYVDSGSVVEWKRVVAVKIEMTTPVQAADKIYSAKDGQDLRYSTTVPVRNQVRL